MILRGLVALLVSACLMVGVMLRYHTFSSLLGKTTKKRLIISYLVLFVVNTVLLWFALGSDSWMRAFRHDYFLFPLITTLLNICVIKHHTKEHLFVYGTVITCNFTLVSLVILVADPVPGVDARLKYMIAAVAYLLLLIAFYWPERWLLRRTVEPFLTLDNGNYWNTIWPIPITAYFSMLFVSEGSMRLESIYQMVGRGLICCVAVLMCLAVAKDHKRMRSMQSMEERLAMQQAHYDSMAARVQDLRKVHHDYKHLRSAVRGYIEAGDREGLFAFGQSFVAEGINTDENIPYTGNAAADGVLYYYMNRAAKHNISMELRGTIKSPGIADTDLSVLLGNALENAIQGCLTVEKDRFIAVVTSSEEQVLSIMVRNSFDGVVVQRKGKFLSRRRDNAMGLGMASMELICQQCGGSMETLWDENTFTVMFLLPVKPPNMETEY